LALRPWKVAATRSKGNATARIRRLPLVDERTFRQLHAQQRLVEVGNGVQFANGIRVELQP